MSTCWASSLPQTQMQYVHPYSMSTLMNHPSSHPMSASFTPQRKGQVRTESKMHRPGSKSRSGMSLIMFWVAKTGSLIQTLRSSSKKIHRSGVNTTYHLSKPALSKYWEMICSSIGIYLIIFRADWAIGNLKSQAVFEDFSAGLLLMAKPRCGGGSVLIQLETIFLYSRQPNSGCLQVDSIPAKVHPLNNVPFTSGCLVVACQEIWSAIKDWLLGNMYCATPLMTMDFWRTTSSLKTWKRSWNMTSTSRITSLAYRELSNPGWRITLRIGRQGFWLRTGRQETCELWWAERVILEMWASCLGSNLWNANAVSRQLLAFASPFKPPSAHLLYLLIKPHTALGGFSPTTLGSWHLSPHDPRADPGSGSPCSYAPELSATFSL